MDFKNKAVGVDAPVYDVGGAVRLEGPDWVAQLWAGPTPDSLAPIGAPCPFRTGVGAGYWNPAPDATRTIPTVAPGATAFVQVKIWYKCDDTTGYDESLLGGGSSVFTVVTGGAGWPPSLPAPLLGLQAGPYLGGALANAGDNHSSARRPSGRTGAGSHLFCRD